MPHNNSEEDLLAQLHFAMVPASASVATFNVRDVYWEFLDRSLHFTFPVWIPCRCAYCEFRIDGTCSSRNETVFQPFQPRRNRFQPLMIGFQPRITSYEPESPTSRCIICFDLIAPSIETVEVASQLPSGICCPRNHVICRGCLNDLIIEHCSTVLHTPSTPSRVRCPACQAQFHPLMQRDSSTVAVPSYTEEQLKNACGGACSNALQLLDSVAQADKQLQAMSDSDQILNGNTDCYLCPKCKFGPVAHRACSDLVVHHGTDGVSNSCPKCGFLGCDITDWIQIAKPRASVLSHRRPSAFHEAMQMMPRIYERSRINNWTIYERAIVNGHQAIARECSEVPSSPSSTQLLYDLHTCYWDGRARRLLQTAWRAAGAVAADIVSVVPASTFLTLANGDGSEEYAAQEHLHGGSRSHLWPMSQESHRCLRVTCASSACSTSQCSLLEFLHSPALPHHTNCPGRRRKCQSLPTVNVRLLIRLFEMALAASVDYIKPRMSIKYCAEADGMNWQLESRREKQHDCPPVM